MHVIERGSEVRVFDFLCQYLDCHSVSLHPLRESMHGGFAPVDPLASIPRRIVVTQAHGLCDY
jgi:hypothetical protein